MVKTDVDIVDAQKRASKAILARYAKSSGKVRGSKSAHSWRQIGSQLGFAGAYLRDVAYGRRKASLKLLHALNIKPKSVVALVTPCKKCGSVHVAKRCTHRKTFEDNAREYDEWLRDPKTQAKLQEMMQWAESKENHNVIEIR